MLWTGMYKGSEVKILEIFWRLNHKVFGGLVVIYDKRKKLKMTPRFLAWATERNELLLTEIEKSIDDSFLKGAGEGQF